MGSPSDIVTLISSGEGGACEVEKVGRDGEGDVSGGGDDGGEVGGEGGSVTGGGDVSGSGGGGGGGGGGGVAVVNFLHSNTYDDPVRTKNSLYPSLHLH